LREEIEVLTKKLKIQIDEYEKLNVIHRKCPETIAKLELEIRRLMIVIEDLKRSRRDVSEEEDVEEKYEIVGTVKVDHLEQQYEGRSGV